MSSYSGKAKPRASGTFSSPPGDYVLVKTTGIMPSMSNQSIRASPCDTDVLPFHSGRIGGIGAVQPSPWYISGPLPNGTHPFPTSHTHSLDAFCFFLCCSRCSFNGLPQISHHLLSSWCHFSRLEFWGSAGAMFSAMWRAGSEGLGTPWQTVASCLAAGGANFGLALKVSGDRSGLLVHRKGAPLVSFWGPIGYI